LKLSNILIDNEYNLKFCDFGFSRWNGKMAIEKRTIAGSEGYTAPEIWKPEPNY
jgi:serine/threonine-protein kinase ULK/ATG1/calcium/calmodulin-dependent protein kinase I